MIHSKRTTAYFFLGFMFLACGRSVNAIPAAATPIPDRHGCGDYTILSKERDRAVFDRHCETNSQADYRILLDHIKGLDPKAEAHAAAERGNFRLAAVINGGPPPSKRVRLWNTEGINCQNLGNSDVAIWSKLSDVLYSPTFQILQINMVAFAKAYNQALIAERGFPAERGCKQSTETN